MYWPFVIFGLPRSRTKWLSQWLSCGGGQVGHDLALGPKTIQQYLDGLWHGQYMGTVETGAAVGWKSLRLAMPGSKFVTVRRDREAVLESLEELGFSPTKETEADLAERDVFLDELETAGATRIAFGDLNDVNCCAWLFEHLLDFPFDFKWWQQLAPQVVSLTGQEFAKRNLENLDAAIGLKAQALAANAALAAGEPLFFSRIGFEPWPSLWIEAAELAAVHHKETQNGSDRRNHPFKIHEETMQVLWSSGALKPITCRVNGKLVGYCIWVLQRDPEADGMVFADQGPWYVDPAFPGHGVKLLTRSLDLLRGLGLKSFQLHRPPYGRGAKLDKLFERLGAVPLQHRWGLTDG